MKIVTFFSEKGGVGKSSIAIMFTSWLKYHLGYKVAMVDYNLRIKNYRLDEIDSRKKLQEDSEEEIPSFDMKEAWPIVSFEPSDRLDMEKDYPKNMYSKWLSDKIRDGELSDMDFVICDFPGSITGGEFFDIAFRRMLNYVFIPTEMDPMTMKSTLMISRVLSSRKIPYAIFFNKVNAGLPNIKKQYVNAAHELVAKKYPVLPDFVAYSEKMKTIEKADILRSTFYYPNYDNPAYGSSRDLGTVNLFIDVMKELRKTGDFLGTNPVDMSIVDTMKKTNDGKQFSGSSFPMYELASEPEYNL